MSDVRPPVAVEACGACDVTHPNGWGWTAEAGRHRQIPPVDSQREKREAALRAPDAYSAAPAAELRAAEALNLIEQFGGIDGGHHKQWVLDQVARVLLGSDAAYASWTKVMAGDSTDEDNYYGPWDEGIAP